MPYIKLYLLTLLIFLSVDFIWLGLIAKKIYREQIGFLMTDEIRWTSALLFYLIYAVGIVFFALSPALKEGSWWIALSYGALFGFICYATYDLTNLATLKGWPVKIVVYDLLWGSFVTGITSLLSFWISHQYLKIVL